MPPLRTRFAPSPTGYLHLGHLVNAIYTWGLAEVLGADILLRLEDHDRGRCRPEYDQAILEDLAWLGLTTKTPVLRQSEREARYAALLDDLVARGLAYTCTCSRKTILARTGPQASELCYDNHCRDQGYRPEVEGGTRVLLEREAIAFPDLLLGRQLQEPAAQCGDLLIKDRHGNWTYQFAVTVDDWDQGVNLVIRGEDLLDSTGRQMQLARMLGRDEPARFLHHPLIADTTGQKLSKRDFAKSLRDYRTEGHTPEELLGEAACRVGLISPGASCAATELSTVIRACPSTQSAHSQILSGISPS